MPITFSDFLHPKRFHINSCEESSSPAGLNNWLSVYCTVTLCWTLICSPHMSWPLPLTPLASSHTQSRHCKKERFKRPQHRFIHWQTRIDPLWPWVIMPKHFQEFTPQHPAESFWRGLCMSGPKGTTTHVLSLVPFIHWVIKFGSGSASGLCPCQDLQSVLSDSASFKQIIYYVCFNCQTGT